jgi:hypothetical protein
LQLRPLLIIPSPRDIPIVKEHIDQLRIDKLWLKYYPELEAYKLGREYFLDNDYTHLILCPDDLIVKRYDLARLIYDINRFNFACVSGLCNVDSKDPKTIYNITELENLPDANPGKRRYIWITEAIIKARHSIEPFRVGYAGFPLMAISKHVANKIPFRNDGGCCIDVMFCWDCAQNNIPIFVDPKINMLHLKREDGLYEEYKVGQNKPFIYIQELQQ